MTSANWSYPTDIRFGPGRIKEIADICVENHIERPLLVTDRNLVVLSSTNTIIEALEKKFTCQVFSNVDSNPTEKNLTSGLEAFKEGGHDGIIALGGGSALDLGKLIAFMSSQSRSVWEFEDVSDWWKRANSSNIVPIIAIPTTAGTGSEVGRAAVLTNSDLQLKKIIFHPKMLPLTVICDPVLTTSMPKSLTAGTGLDAFAHCLEAYCSPFFHPMSHGIALEGMKLIKDHLFTAYSTGSDLNARSQMMAASMMGAVAFQKGLGAIHALSHPIGAIYDTHHGMTNAVLMPFVLKFNKSEIELKIDALATYLQIENGFEGFMAFLDDLMRNLGVPRSLEALGATKIDIDLIVKGALSDPSRLGNPIKLTSKNLRLLLENVS